MRRRSPLIPLVLGIALLLAPPVWATGVTDLPIAQTLTFPQLSAPVDVVRDTHGIPHVYAATLNDAAFVIGYVHATDRMFQMDVFRRIPSGTVSELLGFPDFQIGAGPDPTVPPFPATSATSPRISSSRRSACAGPPSIRSTRCRRRCRARSSRTPTA